MRRMDMLSIRYHPLPRLQNHSSHPFPQSKLMEEHAAAEAERDELRRQVAAAKAAREAEAPELDAVRRECGALEAEIEELNATQAKLRAHTHGQKKKKQEAKDRTAAAQFRSLTAQGEADKLREGVVADADGVRSRLDAASRALEEAQGALHDAERARREASVRLEVVQRAEGEVKEASGLMGKARAELARLQEAAEEVRERVGELERLKAESTEAETHSSHVQRQERRMETKIREFRSSAEVKRAASDRALAAQRDELETLRNRAQALGRDAQDGAAQLEELRGARRAARQEHEAMCAEMDESLRGLLVAVEDWHQRLREGMARSENKVASALKGMGVLPAAPRSSGTSSRASSGAGSAGRADDGTRQFEMGAAPGASSGFRRSSSTNSSSQKRRSSRGGVTSEDRAPLGSAVSPPLTRSAAKRKGSGAASGRKGSASPASGLRRSRRLSGHGV